MSRRRLLAVEAILIAAGVAAVLATLLWRPGSASDEAPPLTVIIRQAGADRANPLLAACVLDATEQVCTQSVAEPEICDFAPEGQPLAGHQILSYYGNPYSADMGILGELEPQALVDRLQAHAQRYDSLNGIRDVQAALHLVYATAQPYPGTQGLYLAYLDEKTLQEYIELACDNGLLVFLDLQIGRSDVETELTKILPYLEQPHVHVALDPEFAMAPGQVPGRSIGSLDATHVNAAQAILQEFLEVRDLPDKVLVVHQFTHDMLTNPELLEDYPQVRLVVDMDGFGPAEVKRVKYGWFAAPAEYSGIKLFFRHDTELMTEQEVLQLKPHVIIYQ
jgi:hypothetical protein